MAPQARCKEMSSAAPVEIQTQRMEPYLRVHSACGGKGCNSLDWRSDLREWLPEPLGSSSGLLSVSGKPVPSFRDFCKGRHSRAGALVSRAGLSLGARWGFSHFQLAGFPPCPALGQRFACGVPGPGSVPEGCRSRSQQRPWPVLPNPSLCPIYPCLCLPPQSRH